MRKVFKLLIVLFAAIGVAACAGAGYAYAAHSELVDQFWAVRQDFQSVPQQRRHEVIAELPARITFEREIGQDMNDLPPERRQELYTQLARSRDSLFSAFKQRIRAEAEIVRKAAAAEMAVGEVTRRIERQLGKVEVGVEMTARPKARRADPLSGVNSARREVSSARLAYARVHDSGRDRVDSAVSLLEALDRLADELGAARSSELAAEEHQRLSEIVTDAKATLYDVKQTPGLFENAKARKLLKSIPPKLSG